TIARRSTGCSSTTPWTCSGATGFTWVSRRGGGTDGGGKRARGRRAVAGRARVRGRRAGPTGDSRGWKRGDGHVARGGVARRRRHLHGVGRGGHPQEAARGVAQDRKSVV